jgi:hypothetical protein
MVRKALLAAAVVAVLAVSSAVPATAAEPDQPAIYQIGEPASVEARFAYGAARGDSIPIGVDTRRVIIEPTETESAGSLRGTVTCTFYGSHSDSIDTADDNVPLGGSVSRQWSAAEWADPAERFLDLPAGTVAVWPNRDEDDYDRFDLFCDAFQQGVARQVTRLLWRLTPYEVVAPVVTLVEDPGLRFADEVSSRYVDGGPRRALATGQEVRVVAPAGTWPVIGSGTGTSGNLQVRLVTLSDQVTLPAAVSDDRSTVSFAIPELTTPVGAAEGAYLSILSDGSRASDGRTVTRHTTWRAPVAVNVAGIGPSQTTLAVSRYAISRWRPTAVVTVERAATTPADSSWGSVRIFVDGEQFGPDVSLDPGGRARVRLPYFDPGRHVVSAAYLGDPTTAPSSSPGAPVRVFF